jgi:pimeloyl-ACP methyl ester carboxylesterase
VADEARYREAEQRLWASVGVAPIEQRLHLVRTGATVRVQEAGHGPPVVFVHGASSNGASWAPLVARLDGFRCIVLDRPGCGLSEPLATSFRDVDELNVFADALLVDVLDALELDRAHVVATSFGGYYALRASAAHAARIDRVVELGWTVGAPAARMPFAMRVASVPVVGRALAAAPPTARTVRMIFRGLGLGPALEAGRVAPEVLDCYLALLRDTDTMRNELRAGPRLIGPLRGMDEQALLPANLLARIDTPVYFLWGANDPLGGADIARRFTARLANAELELVPEAGHAVWIDDPGHASSTTHRFLTAKGPVGHGRIRS